jgi:hypothetical protein
MKKLFGFFFGSYRLLWRDLSNYFYIRSQFKKFRSSAELKALRLRINWVNCIYTVINLRPEEAGEEKQVMQTRVLQKVGHINEFLGEDLMLDEILVPKLDEIDSLNYKLTYYPYLPNTNIWIILKTLGLGYLIYWGISKFDILNVIATYFMELLQFFSL